MPKRNKQQPPQRTRPNSPRLYLLDQFSARDIEAWKELSKDLDELILRMYLDVEPARIRYRDELLAALNECSSETLPLDGWFRAIDFRWSNDPLSCFGSIRTYGGRFNIGVDVEHAIYGPNPALYLAEDFETAYREMRQLGADETKDGLTADELALGRSMSAVRVRGQVERVLDASSTQNLEPFMKVLRKIKVPSSAKPIMRRLKAPRGAVQMIDSHARMRQILEGNWREFPVQYGVPAPSQVFGELVIAAGYEAIKYRSSKQPHKNCLAVFPGNIASDRTFIELMDPTPESVACNRLDQDSVCTLDGMDQLWVPRQFRRGER